MRRWLATFLATAVVFAVSLYAFNLADRTGRGTYLIFASVAGVVIAAVVATLDAIAAGGSTRRSRLRSLARRLLSDDDNDD
jgi:uncharacterized membrane protein